MEIFVDFGLFELIVATGLVAVSRRVYASRLLSVLFLAATVLGPLGIVFLAQVELVRWIGVACLVTASVNVATILTIMRRHNVKTLLEKPVVAPVSSKV